MDLTTLPQRSWEPEGRLALATMRAAYRLGESVTFRIVGTHGTSVEVSVGRGHQQYTFAENEVGCRDAADWLEGLAKDDLTPPTPLGVREDRSEEDGRCPNRNTHEQVKP